MQLSSLDDIFIDYSEPSYIWFCRVGQEIIDVDGAYKIKEEDFNNLFKLVKVLNIPHIIFHWELLARNKEFYDNVAPSARDIIHKFIKAVIEYRSNKNYNKDDDEPTSTPEPILIEPTSTPEQVIDLCIDFQNVSKRFSKMLVITSVLIKMHLHALIISRESKLLCIIRASTRIRMNTLLIIFF